MRGNWRVRLKHPMNSGFGLVSRLCTGRALHPARDPNPSKVIPTLDKPDSKLVPAPILGDQRKLAASILLKGALEEPYRSSVCPTRGSTEGEGAWAG